MMTEQDVLNFWDQHKIFQKSIDQRSRENAYTFYDGPPFATGLPHYGHLVASTIKDVIPRYWTMNGKRVERVWGWDCHGLPIENIIEQDLGLGSRKAILEYGIERFNRACRARVLEYAQEWKKTIRRFGRWVDMERAYTTMDLSYMESVWWVFKELWNKGLIYEGRKSMHICPRCETVLSNFEVTQGYKDIEDGAIIPLFTITSGRFAGRKIAAWTTTAWTLPGNVLLAVHPQKTYILAIMTIGGTSQDVILAKDRYSLLETITGTPPTISEEFPATELIGATYEPLLAVFANHANAFRIVAAPFVTTEEGTGVVHIAPGFGEDDMNLCQQEGVDPIVHIAMNGQFIPDVVQWFQSVGVDLSNVQAKPKDEPSRTDGLIAAYLKDAGRLLDRGTITHSYPHCWRCDTPLLNYTSNSWFVKVAELKEQLLHNNQSIHWVPEHMKDGRFGKWLQGARDWAISRSRFWGTPLPIWKSEDGEVLCIGSVAELERLSGATVNDLHKDVVDAIVIHKDDKAYRRIDEVLDCWFESGSMPYAQWHYPFENKERFEKGFPAEFIGEGQDQTRGWFYTLHVLATALFGKPAFKNVVVNGIVLAEDGKKMSKRLKNYPEPEAIIDRYGADALRMYLCLSPVMEAENINFSEKGVEEVYKKVTLMLKNILSFWQLYCDASSSPAPETPPASPNVLDQWIIARSHELDHGITVTMEAYHISDAARLFIPFIDDCSTWYVRRSRERFKGADAVARERAIQTLGWVLRNTAMCLAPFMPMFAESIYQALRLKVKSQESKVAKESVHLEDWPSVMNPESGIRNQAQNVIEMMERVRRLASLAHQQRADAGIKVRQPLGRLTIRMSLESASLDILRDEVNVKEIVVDDSLPQEVKLDTTITNALNDEGLVRELVHTINALRKKQGLTIKDTITTMVMGDDALRTLLDKHGSHIAQSTISRTIEWRTQPRLDMHTATVNGQSIGIYITKVNL